MKRYMLSVLAILCSVILSSCMMIAYESAEPADEEVYYEPQEEEILPEEEPEPEISLEDLPDPVMIEADFDVTVNPDGTFVVYTNLPSETELSLKLSGRGYLAQGKAYVKDGVAVSERFTNRGDQLVGNYTLEVMMPIPNVQSDYVKHFIGKNGEYLTGPNLQGALGTVVVVEEFDVSFFPDSANANETENANNNGTSGQNDEEKDWDFYKTPTGKKFHTDRECAGKNSYGITDITGLDPCSKCVDL